MCETSSMVICSTVPLDVIEGVCSKGTEGNWSQPAPSVFPKRGQYYQGTGKDCRFPDPFVTQIPPWRGTRHWLLQTGTWFFQKPPSTSEISGSSILPSCLKQQRKISAGNLVWKTRLKSQTLVLFKGRCCLNNSCLNEMLAHPAPNGGHPRFHGPAVAD